MTLREEAARFRPVDIDRLTENDDTVTEAMRMACVQYNSALRELSGGSAGAARNQLRKAVALYPEFDHAVILYGICTFYMGDRTGAMRIFNSVKTPRERSRAMRIYDRLASEDSGAGDQVWLGNARLRTSANADTEFLDSVYLKREAPDPFEDDAGRDRRYGSLFIDGDTGVSGGSSVKISTSGWSKSGSGERQPGEAGRRRTTVTVRRIPELEEEERSKRKPRGILAVVIGALLITALALAIALAVSSARNRSLKQKLERYDDTAASMPYHFQADPGNFRTDPGIFQADPDLCPAADGADRLVL